MYCLSFFNIFIFAIDIYILSYQFYVFLDMSIDSIEKKSDFIVSLDDL